MKEKPAYWAVRPQDPAKHTFVRITIRKVSTLKDAVECCFETDPYGYEAKRLSSRVADIQVQKRRMAMLQDPEGWIRPGPRHWEKREPKKAAENRKVKKWVGTPPTECNICKQQPKGHFVDGRVDLGRRGSGWALVCMNCWSKFGTRLGLGYGQKYSVDTLEKVEG